jgi:hypothetical protein
LSEEQKFPRQIFPDPCQKIFPRRTSFRLILALKAFVAAAGYEKKTSYFGIASRKRIKGRKTFGSSDFMNHRIDRLWGVGKVHDAIASCCFSS